MPALTRSAAWQALQAHAKTIARVPMRTLFEQEPRRFQRLSLEACGILLDYSRNRLTNRTLALLLQLAREADLGRWIERMFRGDRINATEGRAVLHTALRRPADRPLELEGADIMPAVEAVRARMRDLAEAVRSGTRTGFRGERITDVVSIGIGGSHLGPEMACLALEPYAAPEIGVHFLSNVDGGPVHRLLQRLDPARTLFLVVSKTFTTAETLANARTARSWFLERGGGAEALPRHFLAVSANPAAVAAFGLDPAAGFTMWDWVGGRYSLWSAVGLPVAIAVGYERFAEMLAGAAAMDEHFRSAPFEANMPVLLALIGIWNVDFQGAASRAVLPYDQSLARFPAYLQQAEMESNGKRVTRAGEPVDYATAPVVWGEPGTNGQHAFMQALHQGTGFVPVDFLLAAEPRHPLREHHEALIANGLAQAEALMRGRSEAELRAEMAAAGLPAAEIERLAPHRACPGNRPSNMLLYRTLDPRTLGSLIALYEHKIFAEGAIWGIESFDQWGVELGKRLAGRILPQLEGSAEGAPADPATAGLLAHIRRLRAGG